MRWVCRWFGHKPTAFDFATATEVCSRCQAVLDAKAPVVVEPKRVALALAGFQAVDAVACAIPMPFIKADLDRIGCPERLQRALPMIKGASAIGLVGGLRMPRLGALSSAALVAYFAAAIGFHVHARDHLTRSAPAAALGTWAAFTLLRVFRPAASQ
jgi:hypothetical protein